ncbi:MAG: hypothetical protein ACK5P4_04150 [Bacteroidota bacterium]
MKKIILIIFALFGFILQNHAQNKFTIDEKTEIAENIDSLLIKYFDLCNITKRVENDKKNIKEISLRLTKYRALFEKEAIVYDDINAKFSSFQKKGEQPYILEEKNLTDFFNGLIDEFPYGLITSNYNLNISYHDLKNNYVSVALDRSISGVSYTNRYHFSNHDTLKLILSVKPNKEVKISKIEKIGNSYNLKVLNDKDLDGVIDAEDDCPDERGKIALKGCPDNDNDGIINKEDYCPDEFGPKQNNGCPPSTFSYRFVSSVSAGLGFSNTNLSLGTLSETGYKNLKSGSKEDAEAGEIINDSYKLGFNFNGLIGMYFGKTKGNRNKGISLGIMLTSYDATYTLNGTRYYFGVPDPLGSGSNATFEKRLTLKDGAKETIQYDYFSFPLLFKLKNKFSKSPKLAWELGIGPSLIYSRASLKKVEAVVDFEGVYQSDKDGNFSYQPNHNKGINDVRLIATEIEGKVNNYDDSRPKVDDIFAYYSQNGIDVKRNVSYADNYVDVASARISYAINCTGDLFYHISAKSALKIGFAFFYGPSFQNNTSDENKGNNYQMIVKNEKADANTKFNQNNGSGGIYNSIYNSAVKQSFISFGLNAGIIIGL